VLSRVAAAWVFCGRDRLIGSQLVSGGTSSGIYRGGEQRAEVDSDGGLGFDDRRSRLSGAGVEVEFGVEGIPEVLVLVGGRLFPGRCGHASTLVRKAQMPRKSHQSHPHLPPTALGLPAAVTLRMPSTGAMSARADVTALCHPGFPPVS
jgi:hypothetical protein